MRQVNHLRAFDARAAGTSLEKEVLAIFQVNDMYTASRSMRLPAGAAHIDTDLVVTHRQGCMAYSVLVECKNFTRKRVDQGVVAQLNQTRLLVGAQCALLISALGNHTSRRVPSLGALHNRRVEGSHAVGTTR